MEVATRVSAEGLIVDVRLRRGRFAFRTNLALAPARGVRAIGPSGSGKTTFLRLIAGHDEAEDGAVIHGGRVWSDAAAKIRLAPHRRAATLVFQDARLFAHRDVAGNLDLAERAADRRAGGGPSPARAEIVEAFDIGRLLHERPDDLSGGERQRAALAQGVLARPALLLLDEPFAAQDGARRAACADFLLSWMRRGAFGVIIASHGEDPLSAAAAQTVAFSEGSGALAASAP